MRRRSMRLAGALASALVCAMAAAPSAQAAPSADASATATLGASLSGLLDAGQQQELQGLAAQLQSGQAPTGAALAPVQDLLVQLAATPSLPPDVQALVAQIAALLGGAPAGEALDPSALAPAATLLRDLAGTSGVPADAAALLDQLADALDGSGAAPGLPVDALSLPPGLVAQLRDLLDALERGGTPTGTALAPVGELLDEVAATPGLPPASSGLLTSLADSLRGTTGELDPLVADQVAGALDSIASTSGLTPGQRTTIERISTLIVRSSGGAAGGARARTATKRDRAVIRRIRVNDARTRVGIRVACPRSAPATCATTVTARLDGRKAARGKHVRIAAGRSKVVRLRLAHAARTASARHGGRLRVRVATAFGAQRFADAKTVRVRARHR